MPNYSTNLKTWGATGQEYPNGYNYVEGEQPVDAWDNFVVDNIIKDIEHLINVTNNELLARDGSVSLQGDLDGGGTLIWDSSASHVEQSALENDSVTVAGNTVSLGGSIGIALGDLSDVTATGEGSGNGFEADQVDGYDIQKNGSDAAGVINLKT